MVLQWFRTSWNRNDDNGTIMGIDKKRRYDGLDMRSHVRCDICSRTALWFLWKASAWSYNKILVYWQSEKVTEKIKCQLPMIWFALHHVTLRLDVVFPPLFHDIRFFCPRLVISPKTVFPTKSIWAASSRVYITVCWNRLPNLLQSLV